MKAINYTDYKGMKESSLNWEYLCAYQLLPTAMDGTHKVILLDAMQLSYTYRVGGMMHNARSPKRMFSIAVVHECQESACFNSMKIKKNDILFFDDTNFIDFMSKGKLKASIVSLPKETTLLNNKLKEANGFFINSQENSLAPFLLELFSREIKSSEYKDIESKLKKRILELLEHKKLQKPKLTSGEKIALKIREKFYKNMDIKVDIKALALEYSISEQTLQNSFKSLFGFTPKIFLRQLKLNHVHYELLETSSQLSSVSKIAQKWGFKHMGHFARYYKELFQETPSATLERNSESIVGITESCVVRVEEI